VLWREMKGLRMIESVMEGDEGIKRKNYKELILFSRIQRLRDIENT